MAPDREYLALIHRLVCVVHLKCYGKLAQAAEAHHIEFNRGDHSDFAAVPLCGACHDGLHERRRRAFYLAHKLTDVKLLAWTAELVLEYLTSDEAGRAAGNWVLRGDRARLVAPP